MMNPESGVRDSETHRSSFITPHFLLHGVTGSGKTEIYLRAIEATLAAGKQAIALVPEIALTPQTVRRFAARFGQRVTVYHSELSPGERYDVWRKARAGEVKVVVGARSALFLPLPNVGLIVLDEEHDPSYKESQRSPRYHARDAAIHLARHSGATLLLGSATPALETFYAAQLGQIRLLELPRRIMGHAKAIAEQQKQLHLRQTVYRPVDALHPETRYAEPAAGAGDRPAPGAARRQPLHVQPRSARGYGPRAGRAAAGDTVPQPARHGHFRHLPRLRVRAKLRAL